MRSLKILAQIAEREYPGLLANKMKTPVLSDKEKTTVYRLFTDRTFAKAYGRNDAIHQQIFETVYDRLYWPGTDLLK